MAVTDDRAAGRPRPVRAAGDGPGPGADLSPFDRQPPQDLTAEQSVLGGMLLSKDAIADVVEVLRPDDFYRPAHQTVYECILDLYGRGEPADAVTVSAELQRRGDLIRLGGAPYLHTLIATVPTAANAAYYAEIVAEKATLRRLVEAGTRIVQLGYHGVEGGEVNDIVDRAQAAIYEVTERSTSEDYVALEELLQPTMDEIDAIASRGGRLTGRPHRLRGPRRRHERPAPGPDDRRRGASRGWGRPWLSTLRCPLRPAGPPWVTSLSATSFWARTVGPRRSSPPPR